MSNTKIEWTDWSWNPITGCTPISEGCQNCYAKRMAQRHKGRFGYPSDDPFRVTFHPDRIDLPLTKRKPKKIFVNSMGDLFHRDVQFRDIKHVFWIAGRAQQHIFQILTKRPETTVEISSRRIKWSKNIWLGVTVENEKHKDRIDTLRTIPAAVRFISFEPLIGDVGELDLTGIHWVIVGGETGPGARQMRTEWAFNILKQSQRQGVPFFFKKWGPHYPRDNQDKICQRVWREFPQTRRSCFDGT